MAIPEAATRAGLIGSSDGGKSLSMNRRERVYAQLRMDIVEGRLSPGDPLAEVEAAVRLGVSRTPVREALQRLAAEGLVTWIQGRGAFVSGLSIPDVVELFQVREALESYAARLAARSEGHREITPFIERFEASRSLVVEGDLDGYYRLIGEFDQMVLQLAGNGRLRTAVEDVWTHALRVRRLANRNADRLLATVDEHQEIARTIATGDEELASRATARHIRASLQNVVQSLANGATIRTPS